MSVKVSLTQLQERLPELLERVVQTGEEYVVQRNGKDCAVLVSARQWRRRDATRHLDALGPAFVLPRRQQARAEELLAANKERPLTPTERRELNRLLRQSDAIMLRRAAALDHRP